MSQYDDLVTTTHSFPGLNFATGSTNKIKVPRGAQLGRVLDILVNATVLFTQVTTPAVVQVGDGDTADQFASLSVGALAAAATIGGGDLTGGVFKNVYIAGAYNDGDGLHDLIVTFVAPTGGTPAGTGTVLIIMGWDQIAV